MKKPNLITRMFGKFKSIQSTMLVSFSALMVLAIAGFHGDCDALYERDDLRKFDQLYESDHPAGQL